MISFIKYTCHLSTLQELSCRQEITIGPYTALLTPPLIDGTFESPLAFMSELQKSFAKSKLAKLPPDVPMFDSTFDETREEEVSSASSASSTGTLVPSPTQHLFARRSQGSVAPFYPIRFVEAGASYLNCYAGWSA